MRLNQYGNFFNFFFMLILIYISNVIKIFILFGSFLTEYWLIVFSLHKNVCYFQNYKQFSAKTNRGKILKKIIVAQNSFNKQLPKFHTDCLIFISRSTFLNEETMYLHPTNRAEFLKIIYNMKPKPGVINRISAKS